MTHETGPVPDDGKLGTDPVLSWANARIVLYKTNKRDFIVINLAKINTYRGYLPITISLNENAGAIKEQGSSTLSVP